MTTNRTAIALSLLAAIALSATVAGAADPSPAAPTEPKTVTTKSGLQYLDVKVGTGAMPKSGKTVAVKYTIFVDGKRIEGSGLEPMVFTLGKDQALKALEEGVLTMKVGGQRKLIVPPELGYGVEGVPGRVPPNAILNFDLELVQIR